MSWEETFSHVHTQKKERETRIYIKIPLLKHNINYGIIYVDMEPIRA